MTSQCDDPYHEQFGHANRAVLISFVCFSFELKLSL